MFFIFRLGFLSPLVWFFLWLPEEVLALLFLLHCENGDFSILMKDIVISVVTLLVLATTCLSVAGFGLFPLGLGVIKALELWEQPWKTSIVLCGCYTVNCPL